MKTLVLIGLWGFLGAKPTPAPKPEVVITPNPNSKLEFCRQVVNSIPEVCDASEAELGGCSTVINQICPNRKRK